MRSWSTACPDWERRIVARESLIPFGPLFPNEAYAALEVFKSLHIVDATPIEDSETGEMRPPTFGEAGEQWVFDFVLAIFGAYDHSTAKRLIDEFFLLISKKNGKSTIAAGIMITALIRNWRHSAQLLILAPTIEIAKNSFDPARDMVYRDEELRDLLHVQENFRQITHRVTNAVLRVVAADTDTVGGKKASFVLIDELWLFGKRANAEAMFREATGGLVSRPEGFVIFLSTHSDEPPTGVFLEKLKLYRDIRDGKISDPKKLGMLYEFPDAMLEAEAYLDPANFYVTNPNLEVSVFSEWITDKLTEARRGDKAGLNVFLAKHLNVQIGSKLRADRWAGADFWNKSQERVTSLEDLLNRCEVAVIGIDGGGLDDLLGLAVLGREKRAAGAAEDLSKRKWLLWARAWAHEIVLERRKQIATELAEFVKENTLTMVEKPGDDVTAVADIVVRVEESGKLAEGPAIAVDAAGIGSIVDELTSEARGFEKERIVGIAQGWKLNGAIKDAERRVAAGTLIHEGTRLMSWSIGNAKAEQRGNATLITKQISGMAKIDPLMAVFDAVSLMSMNPEPAGSAYEDDDVVV
ncbi:MULTISPECIES: terminase large subunit [unclassified Bradyrhizobium]|uniref:terminase large subunit n=1 Tax=Bradyrhizobium sp. USDA 4541 TaxID=2817704 RepID=UPI0020A4773C|nr:terminase large subunit [Bradyrhizobium sp. USDA 4541]MCP1852807.1 phage terminase large subunit-like protein [Bradyrhizobium sp. USDA 4541]